MSHPQNSTTIVLTQENIRQFNDAYVYGTIVPMRWLEAELRKLYYAICENKVIQAADIYIKNLDEFAKWIDKYYPDFSKTFDLL